MSNVAILVGNAEYINLNNLDCCHDDVVAIEQLLKATEKYAQIEVVENFDADQIKAKIREVVDKNLTLEELFFYFTGHGFQHETEFFLCATNFESRRPNETGLSTSELHALLRLANANLVVKVIDACNSGTLLVKDADQLVSFQKDGFKNLIQISSCLDSQMSLTGDPLSFFTDKFRAAALRKTEGVVYYADVISTLRDEFLNNNSQTPHFVSQGTGREQFVENAKCFDDLRAQLSTPSALVQGDEVSDVVLPPSSAPTLLELLESTEAKLATPDRIQKFVNRVFDGVVERFSASQFSDYFDVAVVEHSDFREPTAEAFIIRVLSKETRTDNFVTATINREMRKKNPFGVSAQLLNFFNTDDQIVETYDLRLNAVMQRAQMKITLTPKYLSLKQIVLVLTCAPSLEHCYVFEVVTQHPLLDFHQYDHEGQEVVRRWYQRFWDVNPDGVVEKIVDKLCELIHSHLDSAKDRLTKSSD